MWIYGSRKGRAFMMTLCQDPGQKSGEVSHVPDLGSIMDHGFKGTSPVSGDALDLPVSGRIVVSRPGPPEPDLGVTLRLPGPV